VYIDKIKFECIQKVTLNYTCLKRSHPYEYGHSKNAMSSWYGLSSIKVQEPFLSRNVLIVRDGIHLKHLQFTGPLEVRL
jgi:hypothetical protein